MHTENNPTTVFRNAYLAPDYLVESLHLDFQIHDGATTVVNTAKYKRQNDDASILVLDGEHMELLGVKLNGSSTHFETTESTLTLSDLPAEFTLEITTRFDPAKNTALEGLYKSGGTYCTQCEAQGFRRITYYQDRPDVMTVFTVRVEADKATCPTLLSNGNMVDEGNVGDDRHFSVWHDPYPKSSYLFALVAGRLEYIREYFMTRSGRKVDLRIYVRDGDQPQCHYAMESLIRSMKWDEDVYGREYQLDRFNIVAVSDFNMGAMENTSLNVFNTALVLAHPETATDADFYRVEGVIAHEYFHNWTGNRVTCRDWFQLSLKEGLTVFRDQEFSADMNSRAVQRIDDVETLRSMQYPEDGGPLAHPVRPDSYIEINNFYTTTVYEKGAEVVRMQHTLLGAESYRKATDLYFKRFDGMAVTCDDFVQCMQDVGGNDMAQFKLWYSLAGTPEVTAKTHYDATAKQFTLTLSQHCPDTPNQTNKPPMYIPVAVGLIGPNGDDMIGTQILPLKDRSEKFIFDNIAVRPVPSLLRNFSAPVRLNSDLSEDDLRFLMVHDSDGFNRWESSQILSLRLIGRMLDALEAGHAAITDRGYLESVDALIGQALNDAKADKALIARMLTLPDMSIIAQERSIVYPDHIHAVLTRIRLDVLAQSEAKLTELYAVLDKNAAYKPDALSMATRSLKAVALDYLTSRGDAAAVVLAKSHYDRANNMTDRMMALSALMDTDVPERTEVFTHFYDTFKSYPLVIDKWFGVQARAVRPQTLMDIENLTNHPDFTWTNPNRVRSLYGAFAMRNAVVFHAADGRGYDAFGNFIAKLDPINPQIASRLLTSLRDWRRYDVGRQDKMRAVLKRILAQPNLSPNVFEIASKILGE